MSVGFVLNLRACSCSSVAASCDRRFFSFVMSSAHYHSTYPLVNAVQDGQLEETVCGFWYGLRLSAISQGVTHLATNKLPEIAFVSTQILPSACHVSI